MKHRTPSKSALKLPGFIAGQLLRFLLLLIAISIGAFLLISISPIDPVQANVGQVSWLNMTEAKRQQLAQYWGSELPIWQRYFGWLQAVLQGDWGSSLRFNAPVTSVIGTRFANSLALMASSWLVSGVLGLALGVVAGLHRDRWLDRAIKGYCLLLASTPTFWLAMLLLMVFAVWLGWLPIGFSVPIGVKASEVTIWQSLGHLLLPMLTLSVLGIANIALHTREKVIDVMQSDYIRYARSRGMGTVRIVFRHGLRNLALPALTLQMASISEIFGGSVLVEQVFSYPGLGQAAVTAGLGGDAPLLVAIAILSAAIVFSGNLTANILYELVDPRMRDRLAARRPRLGGGPVAKDVEKSVDGCATESVTGSVAGGVEKGAAGCAAGSVAGDVEKCAAVGTAEGVAPNPATAPTAASAPVAAAPAAAAQATAAPATASAAAPATVADAILLHRPRRRWLPNRRRSLLLLAITLGLIVAVAAAGLMLAPAAMATDLTLKNLAPGITPTAVDSSHAFGTDWLGRDMFSRTIAGLSTSILVGLLAAGASAVLALALGTMAALGGRRLDAAISWLIDLMLGIPHLLLILLISFAIGKGFWGVAIGVALTHWPNLARVIRAEILQCRQSGFVAVAQKLGQSRLQIALRHMLPYVLPQFIIGLVLLFPHAILHEAAITFLGFGLPPEQPAIGIILSEAMTYLAAGMWWLALFPGLSLLAVVLLFDRVGTSLRSLLDPRRAQE